MVNNLSTDILNNLFCCSESFELPGAVMQVIEDGRLADVLTELRKVNEDLSFDWFTNIFQESHANREKMMQDFTPYSVGRIVSETRAEFTAVADVCAGTGGLTISAWSRNPGAFFYCEELSKRAFPFLLLNLALRNIHGIAVNKDVLSGEIFAVYRVEPGEKFSTINKVERVENLPDFDFIIMNPPYSLKHEWNEKAEDKRFDGYGYPPTKAADFAFLLHGLAFGGDNATIAAVLPHGVLFRGSKEQAIRQRLIENGLFSAVIGLPGKLFLNTGIPVCVIVLDKKKTEKTLFIKADKLFEKGSKLNIMTDEHIEKVLSLYRLRENVDKLSSLVDLEKMKKNDFNLNIPRYVDDWERPVYAPLSEYVREIAVLERDIQECETDLLQMFNQLVGTTKEKQDDLETALKIWEDLRNGRAIQLSL